MTELGRLIKDKREEKNLSQRELAKRAGICNAEVKRIEEGERKRPKPEILKKLAGVLNLPYLYLLELAGYSDLIVIERSFSNEAAIGYMILAATALGLDTKTIIDLDSEMKYFMDLKTVSEAEKAYAKFNS